MNSVYQEEDCLMNIKFTHLINPLHKSRNLESCDMIITIIIIFTVLKMFVDDKLRWKMLQEINKFPEEEHKCNYLKLERFFFY